MDWITNWASNFNITLLKSRDFNQLNAFLQLIASTMAGSNCPQIFAFLAVIVTPFSSRITQPTSIHWNWLNTVVLILHFTQLGSGLFHCGNELTSQCDPYGTEANLACFHWMSALNVALKICISCACWLCNFITLYYVYEKGWGFDETLSTYWQGNACPNERKKEEKLFALEDFNYKC